MSRSLEVWLQLHGLSHLAEVLTAASVDLDILDALSEPDLERLGVSLGDRKRLLRAVALGLPGATTSASAERRMITVMFVDLVDFTAMSRALDPEDLREATRTFQSVCADAVKQFDGSIAQYLGDGILAYFGYPRAHEDDAERAVRAAFNVIGRVSGLLAGHGIPIAVRVGIATGLVVVGDVVSAELVAGQAAIGEAPNVAARLQAMAEPGAIVIAPTTARLLGQRFRLEALPAISLKGLLSPMTAYRVWSEQAVVSRFESRPARGRSALVGRESEFSALWRAWQAAAVGRGSLYLVQGEAGVGKSRLCADLADRLEGIEHARVTLQCSPHHTATPMYPLIRYIEQAAGLQGLDDGPEESTKPTRLTRLRAWLERTLSDQPAELERATAALAALLSIANAPPLPGPPALRWLTTRHCLRTLLLSAAATRPLLLVVEDLHWVDPNTAAWLKELAQPLTAARALVLMTARPEYPSDWVANVMALDRLAPEAAHLLLENTLEGRELAPGMVDRILSKCDGIPLYIEEITQSVLEAVDSTQTATLSIPETLQESLTARLDRLGSAREVLQVGAVIGREFTKPLLAAVMGWNDDRLDAALTWVSRSGLVQVIHANSSPQYLFRHALIQESAYSSLLLADRKRIHGKLAQIIETQFAELIRLTPAVHARHLTAAGQVDAAIDAWFRAGMQEAAVAASGEAVQHFEQALALVRALHADAPDTPAAARRELDILIKLGPVVMMARGTGSEHSARTYERARDLVNRVGNEAERFVVAFSLWYAYENQCRHELTDSMIDEVDRLADASQDTRFFVQARHARWTTALTRGLFTQCLQSTQDGIDTFKTEDRPFHIQTFGGHDPYLCALSNRLCALWYSGDPDGAYRMAETALTESAALQHLPTRIISTFAAVSLYRNALDPQRIRAVADPVVELCNRAGIAYYGGILTIFCGWADAALTNDPASVDLMIEALKRFESTGSRLRVGLFETLIADACLMTGRLPEGTARIASAQRSIEQYGEYAFRTFALVTEGGVHAAQGDLAAAERSYLKAIEVAQSQHALGLELRATRLMAELLGRTQRAAQGLALLSPLIERFPAKLDTVDLNLARAWILGASLAS